MAVNQISVFLENKRGQMYRLAKILADAGINILALNIAESEEYGVARLIVDKPEKAVELLSSNGIIHNISPVIVVAVPDVPGGFASVLGPANGGKWGLEYIYSLFPRVNGMAYIAAKADDYKAVESLLVSRGVKLADNSELGIE